TIIQTYSGVRIALTGRESWPVLLGIRKWYIGCTLGFLGRKSWRGRGKSALAIPAGGAGNVRPLAKPGKAAPNCSVPGEAIPNLSRRGRTPGGATLYRPGPQNEMDSPFAGSLCCGTGGKWPLSPDQRLFPRSPQTRTSYIWHGRAPTPG